MFGLLAPSHVATWPVRKGGDESRLESQALDVSGFECPVRGAWGPDIREIQEQKG